LDRKEIRGASGCATAWLAAGIDPTSERLVASQGRLKVGSLGIAPGNREADEHAAWEQPELSIFAGVRLAAGI